jgi:hypothetical protein
MPHPGTAIGTTTTTCPLFTKTYDLLHWLVPVTLRFPRQQCFVGTVAPQDGSQTPAALCAAFKAPAACRRRVSAAAVELGAGARLAVGIARPV